MLKIADKKISQSEPTYFIAEIGSNHDGKIEQAKELIDKCAQIGADAVKFQSFSAEGLVSKKHPAFDILDKLSLPKAWHWELKEYCDKKNIHFLSTPFDAERLDWLLQIESPAIKISSGDLTYFSFLKKIAETNLPILLATGIASLSEVVDAVSTIEQTGNKQIALLHCVSNYPPQPQDMNLNALGTIQRVFPELVNGLSDHSSGYMAPLGAVAMGGRIIEKHITLSRKLKGPDHPYALEVDDYKEMINKIRDLEIMLGKSGKEPCTNELGEIVGARRGIYAAENIKKGTLITEDMLKFVRPAKGISARYYKDVVGRTTAADIKTDTVISWEMLHEK